MPTREPAAIVIAVDIGNCRLKLGRFDAIGDCVDKAQSGLLPIAARGLPQPAETLELLISSQGDFDTAQLAAWCSEHTPPLAHWVVASVNRTATGALRQWVDRQRPQSADAQFYLLNHRNLDLSVAVDQPDRTGIDRLVAALAANRVRSPDVPAIVVDHGSAITIDLISSDGTFCGGAILPGVAMSARALADGTDALPQIDVSSIRQPPVLVGTDTQAAIESGLWWGNVGAVRELVHQIATEQSPAPTVFVTGGGGKNLAEELAGNTRLQVVHVPQLVLSGIALASQKLLASE